MTKAPEPVVEADDNSHSSSFVEAPKKTWKRFIWDSLDKSPEERRFIFKLDLGLMTICCLGYFIKNIDQSNLTNAFVSGMQEDLQMFGNELNYVTTLWTVGYIIGQVPSNIALTKIRPSIWLPCCEIVWSVLTMCLSRVTNVSQLYALRFFVGLAESGFYPGVVYMMGSWYRKDELAKRVCLFNASSGIAAMFSGYLMTAVINLNGRNGIKGWQWLYIMDGVISLPIAFAGFFLNPDTPANTRAFYLNEHDIGIANKRMQLENRQQKQPYTRAKIVKILSSWHIYLLPLLFFLGGAAGAVAQPIFSLYLKKSTNPVYTVQQINNYPTATNGAQIFTEILYSWISDGLLNGRRWPILVWVSVVNVIIYSSLVAWNIPEGWRWFCYIVAGQGIIVSPMSLVWGNEICSDDNEERAIVVGFMNDFGYIISAWLPLIVWQQVDAPRYRIGFITAVSCATAAIFHTLLIKFLWSRELARKSKNAGNTASETSRVVDYAGDQEKAV